MNPTTTNANAGLAPGAAIKLNDTLQAALSFDPPAPVKRNTRCSPRESRLLRTLLTLPEASRESLDRAIGASNTPDVVFRLRGKGFAIPCDRREVIDRDGNSCWSGWYRLAPDDVVKASALLQKKEAQ